MAFPEIHFHLTHPIDNHELEHDCLIMYASSLNKNDLQEIISFCLTDTTSKWNIQPNSEDQILTFNDLRKQNITAEQLYQWSASIDLIEQYQLYFNSNLSSLAQHVFYNCSSPRFGSQCQYEFIYIPSESYTLTQIISAFYEVSYEPTSMTCYMHLECDRGSKSICLDWTEICDGYVHCLNDQIDETFCWPLVINKCNEDEYRCRNGQCISKQFAFDQSDFYECLDASDYASFFAHNRDMSRQPIINREDVLCDMELQWPVSNEVMSSSCDKIRHSQLIDYQINDKPKTASNICYLAFSCLYYEEKRNEPICKDICAYKKWRLNSCTLIINETCPQIIIVPIAPLAFGHIYVGYLRRNTTTIEPLAPEFICYNETLCTNFQPNVELLTIDNRICRRTQDSAIKFSRFSLELLTITSLTKSVKLGLRHCNTISYEKIDICDSSLMYRCKNSSRCVSIYRLCNKIIDCDYGDDEECSIINGSCSPIESNVLFKCVFNSKCISLNRFGDNKCDCRYDSNSHCEDEPFLSCQTDNFEQCDQYQKEDYIRRHTSFPTICDGFQELSSVLFDGTNHTDETECQLWKCNNTYTRCDGFWNCLDGADEVDCYNEDSSTNCPLHYHICIKPKSFELMCLPLDKANDGHIDCLGATDEPTICRSKNDIQNSRNFYCDSINNTQCSYIYFLCTSKCINDNQDLFCNLTNARNNPCHYSNSSYLLKYLCLRPADQIKSKLIHFSLDRKEQNQQTTTTTRPTSVIKKSFKYNFECHRGYPLRLSFNSNQTSNEIICLCPSSYYGQYCQYQNQRVSLTLRFQSYSHSRRTLFSFVIQLIDNTTQRTIHSAKQITYIYVKHCQTKFNFYLTYSTRPKHPNRTYSIHIDIYEKLTFGYRGSLFIPLQFPFLSVHRVAYFLTIPRDNASLITDCLTDEPCFNGQCMKYAENSSQTTFCHCEEGWTGKDCSIPYNCTCSFDAHCAGIEANGRSICICPSHKWGPRCLLSNAICQSNTNSTCLNNGQCISIDDNMISEEKFFCICSKEFSGDRCEIKDAEIIVSFTEDLNLRETLLIHFIEVRQNNPIRNGSTFQSIPLYQRQITVRWPRPFHIALAQSSQNMLYLISVKKDYNRSKAIRKLLTSSDRCGHMSEYLNETIINYPLIRRIKYYHLPCQNSQISCFYDRDHFCLCNDFGSQRIANCFEFNPLHEHNCLKLSNCQYGGQCLQNDVQCPQTSRCICQKCFYGSLCQFRSSLFDLSLDGIIGPHIRPNLSFSEQARIIKMTFSLIIIMVMIGFINGILCLFAFKNRETRRVGCGYYLFGSTITTLLTSIMLALKFSILLSTQIGLLTNRTFLNAQCYSMDYLLQICLNMDKWLNACVAMERAVSIVKGTQFNAKKSKTVAKYIIIILVLLVSASTIYDPLHRRLVDDDSNDEQKRIWCIVSYSSTLVFLNQFIHLFHFFVPFVLNIISALIIIILTTKRRRKTQVHKTFLEILHEQIEQHRHLLISSIVIVILSLPRFIISFVAGCSKSNSSPWIALMGYLVSFIPPMLVFIIFVLPSKLYKEEFRKTAKEYRQAIRELVARFRNLLH